MARPPWGSVHHPFADPVDPDAFWRERHPASMRGIVPLIQVEATAGKVEDLNARIEELDAERRDPEERRERLEIPAIDREMLSSLLDDLDKVMAEGTNRQEKDLLRRMVKKILVHDRHTIEIWYGLQNQASVRTPGHLALQTVPFSNRRGVRRHARCGLTDLGSTWFVPSGCGPPCPESAWSDRPANVASRVSSSDAPPNGLRLAIGSLSGWTGFSGCVSIPG